MIEYHAAFIACACCGRAVPLPLSMKLDGGFQLQIPDGWELRRYHHGATEIWALCPFCLEVESSDVPTCIACAQPLSGHVENCRVQRQAEDGMAPILALDAILADRKNDLWEIWDFLERKLVGEFPTEDDAKMEIIRLLTEDSSRVRYMVRPPHNVIQLDGYRR